MNAVANSGFLDRLRRGELTLMLGIRTSRTPDIVRIAQATGYHSIMIDLEHSTMSLDAAASLCATAVDLAMTPFVRISEREYGAIGPLLDCGAQGIIAPRIETVDEARTVSRACRFPPRGQRSQLAMVPQFGMRPTRATDLNRALDEQTIVQILLETPAGIANADEIAQLDGVDMLAIGANDLTAELGVPGSFDDPRVTGAVRTVAAACRRHGKLFMLGGISDLAILDTLVPLGISALVLTGMDTDLLYTSADSRAAKFREWHQRGANVAPTEDARS
jgi:2-keto-3-deoxy-L-rhamnonate aldolase RhmA